MSGHDFWVNFLEQRDSGARIKAPSWETVVEMKRLLIARK